MRAEIRKLEGELEGLKISFAEGVDLSKLLSSLTEEETDDIPEDQRSKRKRVDALLKAISARPGQLRFNGGATAILQWNPRFSNRFSTGTGSFDIFAHTSFGEQTLLFFDFEAVGGNGPNQHVSTIGSLNADAGSTQDSDGLDRLHVLEAWAEFSLLNEHVTITAGKIDLTNYFDNNAVANDETSQFLSGAFVNSNALPTPGSTPGVRFRTGILDLIYLQAALVSVDNSGDNVFSDLFKIGSMGFKILPETQWEANLRLYGYLHPSAQNRGGYGLSYDQELSDEIMLFGRWNRNERLLADRFLIKDAWSAGGRYRTHLGENRFVIGLAYGETRPVFTRKEQLAELYARFQLNKWSFLSPHLQWLRPSGGGEALTVLGVRTQFNF